MTMSIEYLQQDDFKKWNAIHKECALEKSIRIGSEKIEIRDNKLISVVKRDVAGQMRSATSWRHFLFRAS